MALDRKRFLAELLAVHGLYDKPLSEIQIRLWCDTLANEDTDAVCRALAAHVADPDRGQFLPKPADVIRMIRGTAQDDALIAWQHLLTQARTIGRAGSPTLTDAQRAGLQGIGGWWRLCNTDESELGFLQRQFCDNYGAAVVVERREALAVSPAVARLAGEVVARIPLEARRG